MKHNYFKKCDLFHIPMSLSYKNEYLYNTNVGAILTILFLIIIIIFSSNEIKTLSEKSSFNIISNQYTDHNEMIDFSKSPLLFQLIDNAGKVLEIDEKLYEFKAYDMEWLVKYDKYGKKTSSVINTKLEMDKCNKILNNSELFSEYDLSSYLCIKSGQNMTSYGTFGDMDNGFKGLRIYLNKCNNRTDCYEDSLILKKLQNIKFRVNYLGLNTNIFSIGNQNLRFQMYSKAFSVSTNLLKKMYFSFSIGRFYLYNSIFFKKKTEFNYIIGNEPIVDIDLDPTSTIDKNSFTLAYFSFNLDGNIVEVSKEVKRIMDTFSNIGNAFNIILTLFRIINNYYSNKILFVDIFKSLFFNKEKNNFNIQKFSQKNFFQNLNNNFNPKNSSNNNKNKNNLDLSSGIGLNNNDNNIFINNFKNSSNKKIINTDKNKISKRLSQLSVNYTINKEKITNRKLIYFYLFPLCILKNHKSFSNICLIKDKICTYFSIEKINELIKFKETLDYRTKKMKVNNTEFVKVKKKFQDSNDSNNENNNNSNNKKI